MTTRTAYDTEKLLPKILCQTTSALSKAASNESGQPNAMIVRHNKTALIASKGEDMAITIPETLKLQALQDTARIEVPEDFNKILAGEQAEISRVVREVLEPNQPVDTTLTELRDVYLSALFFETALSQANYEKSRRTSLQSALRLLEASEYWLKEENRTGTYRVRPVAEVVAASRPWRARISAIGEHAFVFDESLAEQFADVNSTGTLDEEKKDLANLNSLIAQHKEILKKYKLTDELINEGLQLSNEAKGRDFFAILGLRDQEEAISLRNKLLTYAVLLGKEARAAGINACFDYEEARRRFEVKTFRNALRRLRPRRQREEQATQHPTVPTPPQK
jgi:hypothetical protein